MTNSNQDLHVIVAEDNARDMEYLIASVDLPSVEEVTRGDDALELIQKRPGACLISDIQLPGLNGVELATAVWRISPNTRVIVWSQYNDEVYLRSLSRVIPAEALYGYVLKNNPASVLNKAIQSVFYENQCWIDPQVRPVQARNRKEFSPLSNGEYDVLMDISIGLTDMAIAKRRFLSRRGVQSRLKSIYTKLEVDQSLSAQGVNPRSRAVAIALARGLINQFELAKAEKDYIAWGKSNNRSDNS